jgi:hypothetical protein
VSTSSPGSQNSGDDVLGRLPTKRTRTIRRLELGHIAGTSRGEWTATLLTERNLRKYWTSPSKKIGEVTEKLDVGKSINSQKDLVGDYAEINLKYFSMFAKKSLLTIADIQNTILSEPKLYLILS